MISITTTKFRTYGMPVFVDDGKQVESVAGLEAVTALLGWNRDYLAARTNRNRRTVDGWFGGRPIQSEAMNVLRDALEDFNTTKKCKTHKPGI